VILNTYLPAGVRFWLVKAVVPPLGLAAVRVLLAILALRGASRAAAAAAANCQDAQLVRAYDMTCDLSVAAGRHGTEDAAPQQQRRRHPLVTLTEGLHHVLRTQSSTGSPALSRRV